VSSLFLSYWTWRDGLLMFLIFDRVPSARQSHGINLISPADPREIVKRLPLYACFRRAVDKSLPIVVKRDRRTPSGPPRRNVVLRRAPPTPSQIPTLIVVVRVRFYSNGNGGRPAAKVQALICRVTWTAKNAKTDALVKTLCKTGKGTRIKLLRRSLRFVSRQMN